MHSVRMQQRGGARCGENLLLWLSGSMEEKEEEELRVTRLYNAGEQVTFRELYGSKPKRKLRQSTRGQQSCDKRQSTRTG